MKKQVYKVSTVAGLATAMALGFSAAVASGQDGGRELTLTAMGNTEGAYGLTGQAGQVTIKTANQGYSILEFSVSGLRPNKVHSVWLSFDTTRAPFAGERPDFIATDPQTGTTADVFGFAPLAADNAGFTAGIGLDPNGFITDDRGNAKFTIELNYDIFQLESAPVLLRPALSQTVWAVTDPETGRCAAAGARTMDSWIDTGYMRVFDASVVADPPGVSPSYQVLDLQAKPRLVRGKVSAFTLAEHFDGMTHGHVPGRHIGDPTALGCGDWEGRLQGNLANASE
jgi:hypothetical protein